MVTEDRENVNNAAAVDGGVNNAAMREALERLLHGEYRDRCEVTEIAHAALTAPPRNCDRFATVKEAGIAFAREKIDAPQPCPDFTFSAWLFAPAKEQEGGAK